MRGKHGKHPRGDQHARWSDQKIVATTGHVKLRVGKSHPLADSNGYAYEHLVVWVAAGRPRPSPGFVLHHKNEVKTDNRLDNLELLARGIHNRLHNQVNRRDRQTGQFVGKKRAGRLLDGVEHNAWPAA